MSRKIRVALIGCGQISEAHLKEISFIPSAEVVAVCDIIEALGEDIAERFGVRYVFNDYKKMIDEIRPDAVHITTPPNTQLIIGSHVLEQGCHAYIEKPFGINLHQAKSLIDTASENGVIVCAGFSQLYDYVWMKLRDLINKGVLGEIVHLESYYGNSMEGSFSKLFIQNKEHWVQKLPGKMIQNVIHHALYNIIPFFNMPLEKIACLAFARSNNGVFQDELRVMMQSRNITGYLTFTSAVRPITQFLRLYGTRAIVEVDLANHVLSCIEPTALPGSIARVRDCMVLGKNLIIGGMVHAKNMATGRDRFFAGMGNLFKKFYSNIREGKTVPPVPYFCVLNVAKVLDEIIEQCQQME